MNINKVLFFVFLIIATSFYFVFFVLKKSVFNSGKYITYNEYSEKWQKTSKKPVINYNSNNNDKLAEVNQKNESGFKNESIIRGFFERYDKENDLLYIKSAVSFTGEQLYELKVIKIGIQQTFYCAPLKNTDEKTGKTKDTKLYRFPVFDGQTLYTYHEKELSIDDFFNKVNDETWIFLQTTDNYSKEKQNYLYKLVAVGLCE